MTNILFNGFVIDIRKSNSSEFEIMIEILEVWIVRKSNVSYVTTNKVLTPEIQILMNWSFGYHSVKRYLAVIFHLSLSL